MIDSIDSVFSSFLLLQSNPENFADNSLAASLDFIEDKVVGEISRIVEESLRNVTSKQADKIRSGNLDVLSNLDLPISSLLQKAIFDSLVEFFNLGVKTGRQKIINVAPQINIDPKKFDIRNSSVEPALQAMVLKIAGNYKVSTLNKLKLILQKTFIPDPKLGRVLNNKELTKEVSALLGASVDRAQAIVRTEGTKVTNLGRKSLFRSVPQVTHAMFLGINDDRISEICFSRLGLVFEIDSPELDENTPPLHVNCRSVLTPLLNSVDAHRRFIEDESRTLASRRITPLPTGWRVA